MAATGGRPGAQEAPRGLQEAIWPPSGVDFGSSGGPFWRFRRAKEEADARRKARGRAEQEEEEEQEHAEEEQAQQQEQEQQQGQDQEQEAEHEQAQGHEPRTEGRKASRARRNERRS